ncbi:hypothetical protein AMTRI_Chr12g269700 [Amborella trichopoda]
MLALKLKLVVYFQEMFGTENLHEIPHSPKFLFPFGYISSEMVHSFPIPGHYTFGFFQIWRASRITSELQLYCTAISALVFTALMIFACWFHYHKAAPKLAWFQDVESMLNHHLPGLLGLRSLSWAGHQVHVSLPINQFLDDGVDPREIPLPHEFLLNRDLLAQLSPSKKTAAMAFTIVRSLFIGWKNS